MNVKSAVRVLEILEYFDCVQRAASVNEIAATLGYPLSSTSMLLQSLVDRGYLAQGEKRVYRLTPRVKLLGGCLSPLLDANGPVPSMMEWCALLQDAVRRCCAPATAAASAPAPRAAASALAARVARAARAARAEPAPRAQGAVRKLGAAA